MLTPSGSGSTAGHRRSNDVVHRASAGKPSHPGFGRTAGNVAPLSLHQNSTTAQTTKQAWEPQHAPSEIPSPSHSRVIRQLQVASLSPPVRALIEPSRKDEPRFQSCPLPPIPPLFHAPCMCLSTCHSTPVNPSPWTTDEQCILTTSREGPSTFPSPRPSTPTPPCALSSSTKSYPRLSSAPSLSRPRLRTSLM